jgi:hypothetical protein
VHAITDLSPSNAVTDEQHRAAQAASLLQSMPGLRLKWISRVFPLLEIAT